MQSLTEETAGADFVKYPSTSYKAHICPPLPIYISSSNNPAGPDFNQNLNPTWTDVFPMSHVLLWPLLSFSELLESFSVVSHIPSSNLHTPGFFNIWSHQPLLTKASKILIHTSLFFFFEPISPQTASHATVLVLPQQFSTLSCTACNSITKKHYQCSNTEFRTRSTVILLLLQLKFCE